MRIVITIHGKLIDSTTFWKIAAALRGPDTRFSTHSYGVKLLTAYYRYLVQEVLRISPPHFTVVRDKIEFWELKDILKDIFRWEARDPAGVVHYLEHLTLGLDALITCCTNEELAEKIEVFENLVRSLKYTVNTLWSLNVYDEDYYIADLDMDTNELERAVKKAVEVGIIEA